MRETSAGIIQRWLRRLDFKERSETGLPKMMIRGKSIANAELAHDSETDAIGKGPLFIAMLAKPGGCIVKTCRQPIKLTGQFRVRLSREIG